jgi:hypothetical protein
MSARVLAAAVALMASGCGQDMNTGVDPRPPDAGQLIQANDVTREYLLAASNGDAERLCALRTRGALRGLGGRRACLGKLTGIGATTARRTSAQATQRGKVLLVNLRTEGRRYRVSKIGAAAFAD